MELSISFIITIFLIGFIGSYISGMVGIGGSIIKYPMLLYIPPLFGLAAFTAHEVSGISAVQVFFATIGGVWAYRKGGYLNKMLIIYMGSAILLGSFIGGFGSKMMSEGGINLIYGILALIAAVMMFIPNKGVDDIPWIRSSSTNGWPLHWLLWSESEPASSERPARSCSFRSCWLY